MHPLADTKERRFPMVLVRHWDRWRADRPFPSEQALDPDVLGEKWRYCFLVQVRDILNVRDYNYTYLGEGIIRAYQDGEVDGEYATMVGMNASKLTHSFTRVMETRAPVLEEGEFYTLKGRRVRYRQCMLPLGEDGQAVDAIFGGISFISR
jgi:hypothetical protein